MPFAFIFNYSYIKSSSWCFSWYQMTWSSNLETCQTIRHQMDRYVFQRGKLCLQVYIIVEVFYDFSQVKIQKDSEVRLKIIGTRVDATEIVWLSSIILYSFIFSHFLHFNSLPSSIICLILINILLWSSKIISATTCFYPNKFPEEYWESFCFRIVDSSFSIWITKTSFKVNLLTYLYFDN